MTTIVDLFETGEALRSGVGTIDELGKKAVVVKALFVKLTKLLENPREGVLPFIVVVIVDTLEMPLKAP